MNVECNACGSTPWPACESSKMPNTLKLPCEKYMHISWQVRWEHNYVILNIKYCMLVFTSSSLDSQGIY